MSTELQVRDIRNIRITKVLPWKINFRYEGNSYSVLLSKVDAREGKERYRVVIVLNGADFRVLSKSNNIIDHDLIKEFIRDISRVQRQNITYSNVNKEFFVKRLQHHGISTCYAMEYEKMNNESDYIKAKIESLQRTLESVQVKFYNESGHARVYEDSIKIKVSERVQKDAHKKGEWCKEYNDTYGSVHKEYLGVLTDLRSLPYNTRFECTNGNWSGVISCNNHGDKTVVTFKGETVLTEEHCSAYIELWGSEYFEGED